MEINNLTSFSIDNDLFLKTVKIVLEGEGVSEENISLCLVNKEEIKKLNHTYLGRNYVTDVLSFLYEEDGLFGEIVVCPEKVQEDVSGKDFTKEVSRVIIHGVLHLLNYDHAKSSEERSMKEKEENYLRMVFVNKL